MTLPHDQFWSTRDPSASQSGPQWSDGHVIVCGLRGVGLRTVEQLHLSGVSVVVVDDDPDLRLAHVSSRAGVSATCTAAPAWEMAWPRPVWLMPWPSSASRPTNSSHSRSPCGSEKNDPTSASWCSWPTLQSAGRSSE